MPSLKPSSLYIILGFIQTIFKILRLSQIVYLEGRLTREVDIYIVTGSVLPSGPYIRLSLALYLKA